MYLNLSNSQRLAADKIAQGKNVFITGPAGTGKSYLLNYLKEEYRHDGLHITASTGIAAVNVGGQTLHSWAGLGLGNLPIEDLVNNICSARGTHLRKKLIKAKMLAIDEISMISSQLFDMLNELLKIVRNSNKPFGGLQLILFGDFLQLPPIFKYNEIGSFCFESDSWAEAEIEMVNLKEIYRQKDEKLICMLNRLRFGEINNDDLELLRCCYKKQDDDTLFEATILGTHNAQIEKINQEKMDDLHTAEKTFFAEYKGKADKIDFLKKNCIAKEQLTLKIGAQVMMLKNTYAKEGVMNGSIGVVQSFSDRRGYPTVEFSNGVLLTVGADEWCVEKFNENTREMEIEAKIMQVPLTLAWAITTHKSQGMTLDKIRCSLANSFAEGQVYVALSRARSLNGLFIESFNVNAIKANKNVVEFYRKNFPEER